MINIGTGIHCLLVWFIFIKQNFNLLAAYLFFRFHFHIIHCFIDIFYIVHLKKQRTVLITLTFLQVFLNSVSTLKQYLGDEDGIDNIKGKGYTNELQQRWGTNFGYHKNYMTSLSPVINLRRYNYLCIQTRSTKESVSLTLLFVLIQKRALSKRWRLSRNQLWQQFLLYGSCIADCLVCSVSLFSLVSAQN